MINSLDSVVMLRIKKYGYLIAPVSILLVPLGLYLGRTFELDNLFAFFVPFVIYLISPIFDYWIGKDVTNPEQSELLKELTDDRFYRFITYIAVPIVVVNIAVGVYLFIYYPYFNWLGQLGWIWTIGSMSAYIGINSGHELVHKSTRLERRLGSFLMSMVCYSGFKVEHIRHHHVHAATPFDNSYVPRNQSIYEYLPRCIFNNAVTAWKLEKKRLAKQGLSPYHWKSELIWWYGVSLAIFVTCFAYFGAMGVLFFAMQSIIAVMTLETVGYVEHYGLTRKKLPSGRYENMSVEHSWNCQYLLTNLFLLQLPRHPEHHTNPGRRYQILNTRPESPDLPGGYAIMVFLAFIPRLFFKVLNPVLDDYLAARSSNQNVTCDSGRKQKSYVLASIA